LGSLVPGSAAWDVWVRMVLSRHERILHVLAFLEAHGVVHRDIKPDNEFVYIDETGAIHLLVSATGPLDTKAYVDG
jgi:hypothetical protein